MLRYSKTVSKAAGVVEIGVGRNPNQSAITVYVQLLARGMGGVPRWTPIYTIAAAGTVRENFHRFPYLIMAAESNRAILLSY